MALTAIALSGGVDSLLAAHLLQQSGHRLVGIHFLTGYEETSPDVSTDPKATAGGGLAQARRRMAPISRQLRIPVEIVDCRAAFQREVVEYFKAAYQAGRTPNPCMVCNPRIKFGVLLEKAGELGASHLASGHYARVQTDGQGRLHLYQGADVTKDQSYFLARLTPRQLAAALFPLGSMEKRKVRQTAAAQGLQPVTADESQDICFIRGRSYGDFLLNHLGLSPQPGPIVDTGGREIGRHSGLHRFTVGQRRGINCPAPEPYYVVRLEPGARRLVVGAKADLECSGCRLEAMNWIQPPPEKSFRAAVRIRYRHKAVPARIHPLAQSRARVVFESPQAAVTPGQGGVIYRGEEVLGGGWIVDNGDL